MWTARLALLALLHGLCKADQSIVLPPPNVNSSVATKMLVFIPGAKVPNDHYIATAQAVQTVVKTMNLWVVIPAVTQRFCIIDCSAKALCSPLHNAVEGALTAAEAKGWKRGVDKEDLWLAGHSLGGVCANTLFQAYTTGGEPPYAGIMLFGSYVDENGSYDLSNYPQPVLMMNGELDGGLARPGKTAIWWHQYLALESSAGEEYALRRKPVIILPKANHSNFCPGFDVAGDLMAEITQAEATSTIGSIIGAFLDAQLAGSENAPLDVLKDKVSWTRGFLAPYLEAQELEKLTTDTTYSAAGSSPFCTRAQHIIAGLGEADEKRFAVGDGFQPGLGALTHCHTHWNITGGDVSGKGLSVQTCSHTDYYADVDNTGSISAASEIACKMISDERAAQLLNTTIQRPADCKAINKYAVDLAESLAAPSTKDRYDQKGRKWCFLDDTKSLAGPLWVFTDALKLTENATCMSVQSPGLKTGLTSLMYPGNHYCKVLSPARVLDWMMTDSLKPASKSAEPESSVHAMWI